MDASGSRGEEDLLRFVSQVADAARFRIEEDLPHGFVRLKVAEAERRQAQHDIRSVEDVVTELVRNSRDAGARKVLVAFQKEKGRYRRVTVLDDGQGVHPEMHEVIFEPRVTSRREEFGEDRYGVHGRGMALFSIRSRAEDARVLQSAPGQGACVMVLVDNSTVPERSDQASLPRLDTGGDRPEVGTGPHNVGRVLVEMSVDNPGMDFYLGSYSEVLATMRRLALQGQDAAAPWSQLSSVQDARGLCALAERLTGISLSERTAYRVLSGEVSDLVPLAGIALESAAFEGGEVESKAAPTSRAASRHRNPLRRLGRIELEEIGEGAAASAMPVLEKYYLRLRGAPRVRRGRGKLTVTFDVEGEEE